MSFWEVLMVGLGLSADAFAVSVCKGLQIRQVRLSHMALAGSWFGAFQALMPVLGYALGELFAERVARYGHWGAFLILALIGGNMIRESFAPEEEEHTADMAAPTMALLAVATSIDAMAVGVSFALLGMKPFPAVLMIGLITFLCSAAGVKMGSLFGNRFEGKAELAGGAVLILIGVRILAEGLLG
ncbi:MAG: manganese efflux pump [Lachnospiraceae bacterium]|nr:manganese efflux pump [Lachnospiraceae bacterium]